MRLPHFAPPRSPSLDQQRDALRKGLGRAMQWANTRRLDDNPLLEACLQDLRFDLQIEDTRGEWLWRMIRAVGAVGRFRVPVLHALYELSDERSAAQLCDLAGCYAESGDEAFRKRLYEIVEQKPIADSRWLGEEEILRIDGEEAFLFAARVRAEGLAALGWESDDEYLVDQAIKRFGDERVNGLLDNTTDEAIACFRTGWRRQKEAAAGPNESVSRRETVVAITVDDILLAAQSGNQCFSFFRRWGMHADPADLELILGHLQAAREPTVIARLLQVFSNRAAPRFDERLVQLGRHEDAEVRRRAVSALEKIEHPLVREFALAELETGVRGTSVVGLFVRNYRVGDERRILESVEIPDGDCELHWFLMDAIKVLDANPEADCSQLGVIAYASTLCELCRFSAARLLIGRHVAPAWLAEECRFDSNEQCRELVAQITRPPQAESD